MSKDFNSLWGDWLPNMVADFQAKKAERETLIKMRGTSPGETITSLEERNKRLEHRALNLESRILELEAEIVQYKKLVSE